MLPEWLKRYRKSLVALATAITLILAVGLPLPDTVTTVLVAVSSLLGAWGVYAAPNKPDPALTLDLNRRGLRPASLPPPPPQE